MSSIGSRIRLAREALDITQEQLGKLCGTTKQTIFKYECGIVSNIPLDRIEALAHHLQTTPAYLLGWTDNKEVIADQTVSGSSEERQALIDLVMSCPEERAKDLLTAMQLFLQNWQR